MIWHFAAGFTAFRLWQICGMINNVINLGQGRTATSGQRFVLGVIEVLLQKIKHNSSLCGSHFLKGSLFFLPFKY